MRYLLERTARAVLTLWIAVSMAFALIRLIPGGPIAKIRGEVVSKCRGCTDAQIDRRVADRIQKLNIDLNAPIWEQYGQYVWHLLQGDFGYSTAEQTSVGAVIGYSLPWTLFVMTTATVMVFAIAIVWGAVIAYQEGSLFDTTSSAISILMSTVPSYVLAFVLIIMFGYGMAFNVPFTDFTLFQIPGFLPTGRKYARRYDEVVWTVDFFINAFKHAILPMASVVLTQTGLWALSMRGNSIQILGEDYVRVARLRGLADRRIATRYVARNAILPMYTGFLTLIGYNLGASIIIEQVFQYEGLGYFMFQALEERDYGLIMGTFIVYAIALILAVYIADLTYGYIDPRVKSGESSESY